MNGGILPVFGKQHPPLEPHALAIAILHDGRFRQRAVRPPSHTWWQWLWAWISDRFADLGNAFSRHVHVAPGAQSLAGAVLVVLVAGAVVAGMAILLRNAVSGSSHGAAQGRMARRAVAERLSAAADEAARHGDFRVAIALLFRAALAALDLRGIVHDEPSATVNELLREMRERANPVRSAFDAIARAFTDAAYAHRADARAWQSARDAYEALLDAARA